MRLLILTGAAILAALGAASCAATLAEGDRHGFRHVGWVTWSRPVAGVRTPNASATDDLHLTRDSTTNSLSFSVSPSRQSRLLTSFHHTQFDLLLRLTGDVKGCAGTPRMVVPLAQSDQLSLAVSLTPEGAAISAQASRLGRDLMLAALLSPGGLQGFLSCEHTILWIQAKALDLNHAYAQLWERRVGTHSQLYIESRIEVPFHIYRIAIKKAGGGTIFTGDTVVQPWRSAVIGLANGIDLQGAEIEVQAAPSVPTPIVFETHPGGTQ